MLEHKGSIVFNHKSSGHWDDLKLCPKGMSILTEYQEKPINPNTGKPVGGEKQFGITKDGYNFLCNHSLSQIPEFFLFLKDDIISYLESARYEYKQPTQDYCNKNFMSSMYDKKRIEVNNLADKNQLKFYINIRIDPVKANNIAYYLMPWDYNSRVKYYSLLKILLGSNTQSKKNPPYTQIILIKFEDTLTKKIYIYMKPEFIKPYTAQELGKMLNDEIDSSTKDADAIDSLSTTFVYKYRYQICKPDIKIDDIIAEVDCINTAQKNSAKSAMEKEVNAMDAIMGKEITDAQIIIEKLIEADNNLKALNIGCNQVIFYGAPGTGKSFIIGEKYPITKENSFRTTFHPDTDYASFVGSYKPIVETKPGEEAKPGEDEITYKFSEQVFAKAYVEAWKQRENGNPVFLIIDEINRGNCAQIFGDLFQLLDRNTDGYSDYEIKPDSDLEGFIKRQKLNVTAVFNKSGEDISKDINSGKLLKFPPNLFILATMNTSDQSLYPMDSAFKRRWEWVYVPINYEDAAKFHVKIGDDYYKWSEIIQEINKRIKKANSSADKQLGNRFVMADKKDIISSKTFVNKVLFYLWNDIFKDADDDDQIFKNIIEYFEDFFATEDSAKEKLNEDGININKVLAFLNSLNLSPDEDFKEKMKFETDDSIDGTTDDSSRIVESTDDITGEDSEI